jgi:hypothetical protein
MTSMPEINWSEIQTRLARLARTEDDDIADSIDEQVLVKALALLGIPATVQYGIVSVGGLRERIHVTARSLCEKFQILV